MNSGVAIGGRESLKLQGALLVYEGPGGSVVSWHEVRWALGEQGAPSLGAAQPLSVGFVDGLARGLRTEPPLEILPGNVLARTAELLVWWTPACRRVLFFRATDGKVGPLSGRRYPQPALVWKVVAGQELWVRAVRENRRPLAETKLWVAPYWNVDGDSGHVCQGTMRSPQDGGAASSIGEWEKAFFSSAFTHHTGARRITAHPDGFAGLWASLADGPGRFPARHLEPAGETLLEFAGGSR